MLTYRDATINDLPDIVAIYNSTITGRLVTADTTPVSVKDKMAWFHLHNPSSRPLWIVEKKDSPVGWVSFQDFYGRPAYNGTVEISIYLSEAKRGRGYGSLILAHAVSASPALGIHTLLGFIFAHNLPSISLFKKQGFAEYGHLPDVAVMDGNYYSLNIYGKKVTL